MNLEHSVLLRLMLYITTLNTQMVSFEIDPIKGKMKYFCTHHFFPLFKIVIEDQVKSFMQTNALKAIGSDRYLRELQLIQSNILAIFQNINGTNPVFILQLMSIFKPFNNNFPLMIDIADKCYYFVLICCNVAWLDTDSISE